MGPSTPTSRVSHLAGYGTFQVPVDQIKGLKKEVKKTAKAYEKCVTSHEKNDIKTNQKKDYTKVVIAQLDEKYSKELIDAKNRNCQPDMDASASKLATLRAISSTSKISANPNEFINESLDGLIKSNTNKDMFISSDEIDGLFDKVFAELNPTEAGTHNKKLVNYVTQKATAIRENSYFDSNGHVDPRSVKITQSGLGFGDPSSIKQ